MSKMMAATAPGIQAGQWRLERVELLNWGTFQGHHGLDIARKGFLLTGHSGSGKSSLVDAVSAVLTPRGKLHFNAAAQDTSARGEDRTIVSYIRGAWRRSADDETGEVRAEYLRTGATFSGILLRYGDGTGAKPVLLLKLYHLRRGSNTPADVSELSILLQEDATLTDFVDHLRNGIETRRIKSTWPAAYVTDKHSAFASRFCRLMGISGENAVLLLHKTQSAKSLGSLDDLFRQFMLDRPKTFDMANTAVAQFGELSEAHRLVVEAREQVEHLRGLEEPARAFGLNSARAAEAAALSAALPSFKDEWKLTLAKDAKAAAESAALTAQHDVDVAAAATAELEEAHSAARRQVDGHGGQALRDQQTQVDLAQERERDVLCRRAELASKLGAVGISFPASFEEYEELRAAARSERSGLEAARAAGRQTINELHEARGAAKAKVRDLETELKSLRGRRSNLGDRLVTARSVVAEAAGLPASAFPFAGELLEVRKEFADWTGAIERVLRPLATVMLVPEKHIDRVRDAVDGLFLGARLVFESVPSRSEPPRPARTERSLVSRVQVADGPMAGWLHSVLSGNYDYECVDSPAELGGSEKAVTRAGQVKRSRTRHEKDDRSRVDDRSTWVLGFDNADKLELLSSLVQAARATADQLADKVDAAENRREAERLRAEALALTEAHGWDQLDAVRARTRVESHKERLAEILAASGDLRAAEAAAKEAKARWSAAQQAQQAAMQSLAEVKTQLAGLDRIVLGLGPRVAASADVPAELAASLRERFLKQRRSIVHEVIDEVALTVATGLSAEEKQATSQAAAARTAFASLAGEFRRSWPAKAGDLTDQVEDGGGYLALLEQLVADRLPDFETRFFELMERQSQQNVATLANEIRRAPLEVRDRVAPINGSLKRSAFDAGRFLKIVVKENRGELGRKFLSDLQDISTGSWVAQSRDDAEAKFEVMRRIMEKLASSEPGATSWRNQCLDTRLHVRFTATEVDAAGRQLNVYDSSAGLSGGQRQKLVTFCLAAALRYQLAGDGEDVPRYGTVIMDEAFDKADSNFTRIAMDVFTEFGFHMVLATPLKLLQTLEDYIGGMAVVTCREFQDSRIGFLSMDDDGGPGSAPPPVEEPGRGRPGGTGVLENADVEDPAVTGALF